MLASVYICVCKCVLWKEGDESQVSEEKAGKGGPVKVFPRALRVQCTQTVVCFHCSQIPAWPNVFLFRGEREGLQGASKREERQKKGGGHAHTNIIQGLILCSHVSLFFRCQSERVRLPTSFCRNTTSPPACCSCSPLLCITMLLRKQWERWTNVCFEVCVEAWADYETMGPWVRIFKKAPWPFLRARQTDFMVFSLFL